MKTPFAPSPSVCTAMMFMLAVLAMGLYASAHAHAHIFIDYTVNAVFSDSALSGFDVTWTFDRMFSAFIIKEFDSDKNGTFSQEESQAVYTGAFMALKKNGFFTYLSLGTKELPAPVPVNFSCKKLAGDDVVRYRFFIPVSVAAEERRQRVSVFFFDPVIYVSFTVMKDDVAVTAPAAVETDVSVRKVQYTNRPTISFRKVSG